MRQLDWRLIEADSPYGFGMFYASLETPNLTKSGVLTHGRNGLPYNYRDLSDFFDTHQIEWTVESDANNTFIANVADYEADDYCTSHGFLSRYDAEAFAISTAFIYLNERAKSKFN